MRLRLPVAMLSRDLSDQRAASKRVEEVLEDAAGVCGDSGGRVLCITDDAQPGFAEGRAETLHITTLISDCADVEVEWQHPRKRSDLLMLCYTGGTSGSRSKCVEVSHDMALHEVTAYADLLRQVAPGLAESPAVLQQTPAHWSASCFGQVDIALALRGSVVFLRDCSDAVQAAIDTAQRYKVQVVGGVPSVLDLLNPGDVPSLQCVLTWGEALSPGTRARWVRAGRTILDLLISTEYWFALYSLGDEDNGRSVFRVAPGAKVTLLAADEEVSPERPEPDIGRLLVQGPMVMRGYRNEPRGPLDKEGSFLTSDVLKRVGPGRFAYCGRSDFMSKEKGQWVDLGDLETTLSQTAGVEEATIVPDVAGRHVACVVLSPANDASCVRSSLGELRQVVAPHDKVRVQLLKELPRVAVTNKVDKRALLSRLLNCSKLESQRPLPHELQRLLETLSCSAKVLALALMCLRFKITNIALLPYMWLFTLRATEMRPPYGRLMTLRVDFLKDLFGLFPFGRFGLLTTFLWARHRLTEVRGAVLGMALGGAISAARRGRLLAWPVAFWAALPWELQRHEYTGWVRWMRLGRVLSLASALLRPLRSLALPAPRPSKEDAAPTWCSPRAAADPPPLRGVPTPLAKQCHGCGVGYGLESDPDSGKRFCRACRRKFDDWWWKDHFVDDLRDPAELEEYDADDCWRAYTSSAVNTTGDSGDGMAADGQAANGISRGLCAALEQIVGAQVFAKGGGSLAERGVDSLKALRLARAIRSEAGGEVSPEDILKCSSLCALSELVARKQTRNDSSPAAEAKDKSTASGCVAEYTPFFGPGHWWFRSQWFQEHDGPVDAGAFISAVKALADRHVALRSQLLDPIEQHSFLYDSSQIMVMVYQYFDSLGLGPRQRRLVRKLLKVLTWSFKRCWIRVQVRPSPDPGLFQVVHASSEQEVQRQVRAAADQDLFAPPGSFTLIQLHADSSYGNPRTRSVQRSFLHVCLSHALTDGFSIYPLLTDLGELYTAALRDRSHSSRRSLPTLSPIPNAMQVSEDRLFATLEGETDMHRADRQSLRSQVFGNRKQGYIHDVRVAGSAAVALKRLGELYSVPVDVLIVGITVCGLARADQSTRVPLTLYCNMRDGPAESMLVGLFADFRDVSFECPLGSTVLGAILGVHEKIRRREWKTFDGLRNPETTTLNLVTFDEGTCGGFRHSVQGGKQFFPRLRDGDDRTRRVQRPRRMVWERQNFEEWFLGLDLDWRCYDVTWTRRFVLAMQDAMCALAKRPTEPLWTQES
eukprot:TRINITY_DN11110_c1_g1_i1.p1 TRINITY_DN11110_c1_g1~~TRINITY_DN11110_c1_g1_i1.p1  ORF type:complete len:1371 (-),score=135.90 TRINITY_DN11110_c1_g1_i1:160-3984(-)